MNTTTPPRVTVITPTTGAACVFKALESVRAQTLPNVQHLLVIDGPRDFPLHMLDAFPQVDVLQLPYAVGKDRFNGHRIYGACTYLARGEFIVFLDEDNWFEPHHLESLDKVVRSGQDWSYSLRTICDDQGLLLCTDDCESLGQWPTVLGPSDFLIDVSSFYLPRRLALSISPLWYRRTKQPGVMEVDRAITRYLRSKFPKFDCTYQYSMNYRTGNTPISVKSNFFLRGNERMLARYQGQLPWKKSAP